jgi:hypothetical protein
VTGVTRVIGGRKMTAGCAAERQRLAEDLLTAIERASKRTGIREGMRIRFGWSVLTLEPEGEGLIVCEPDFDGDPLRAVRPGVDTTLDVTARQAALLKRVGVEPVDTTFDQMVIVARRAFDGETLQLFRTQPSGNDSGWSISSGDAQSPSDNPDDYEAVHSYTLLRHRPEALAVLPLPPEFGVVIEGPTIAAVLDPQGHERLGRERDPRSERR